MEILGTIPRMQVPEDSFGFYKDKSKAGKTFTEAFPKEFEKYSSKTLERVISGECRFNSKGELEGSNIPVLNLIRTENLLPENQFLFTPLHFAAAFNKNSKAFKGKYQDQGLAITISPDQARDSSILVRTLAKQVKDFGYDASPQKPIFVYHSVLNPRANQSSPYGFIFNIDDKKGIVEAEAFGIDNTIKRFTEYDKNSVPIPKEDGDYTIYSVSKNPGVSGVYSSSDQSADAGNDDLAGSSSIGRVVVGTIVPQDLAEFEKSILQEEERRERWVRDKGKDLGTRLAKLIN